MRIFIDESGSFSGFHDLSIGAVGALAVPDGRLAFIERKYERIRKWLPKPDGEVKGRLLDERQIEAIVRLLARNETIFEVTVIDLGMHTKAGVADYKDALLKGMRQRLPRFNEETRPKVAAQLDGLAATPLNLFLQTIVLFETIHRIIDHVPFYYVQRRPEDLGTFSWIVDGKDPAKVTSWENWWASYAIGALANKSKFRPGSRLIGGDYSHYDRFRMIGDDGEEGVDTALLLEDLRFSSGVEFGLEWVDILTNAIRRALTGNLGVRGWGGIAQTMIHRPQHYIEIATLDGFSKPLLSPPYAHIINRFRSGGKSMMTGHFLRLASEEGDLPRKFD
jgi:hypothetical protein